MEGVNKYYFDLAITFESNYDVKNLESIIGLKPAYVVSYEDSTGPVKSAKFIYQTKETNNLYSDEEFSKFVWELRNDLIVLPQILKENNGKITFYIVFTQIHDKPIISLDSRTIKLLAELGARFEIDYA